MWLFVVAAVAAQAPVLTEFRVFDGLNEVTAVTRLRVVPAGRRNAPAVDASRSPIALAPSMYDVQALRTRDPGIVSIKWVERLAIVHYPDEGGRHLEVINFRPGFGALQLRMNGGRIEPAQVAMFTGIDRNVVVGHPLAGNEYVLVVAPAGRYDVRVQHAEKDEAGHSHWLLAVDVPAGRTRLKLIDARD
jgi:hypothetical protein